jgi:hypothetical protein
LNEKKADYFIQQYLDSMILCSKNAIWLLTIVWFSLLPGQNYPPVDWIHVLWPSVILDAFMRSLFIAPLMDIFFSPLCIYREECYLFLLIKCNRIILYSIESTDFLLIFNRYRSFSIDHRCCLWKFFTFSFT